MKPQTLARLALAGSLTDTLRVTFTAVSSALAAVTLLAAATVVAVPELGSSQDGSDAWNHYSADLVAQPGLRPGVVATLLLVAVPILALAGQCIRFGSPARDRRLAAIRLAGATPSQAVLIAAAETAVSALVGSLVGLGAYFVVRAALDRHDHGRLWLPTDVLPPVLSIVFILLIVPVLAGLTGALLLRRVIITPLGVVRRTREHSPSALPGILIIAGVASPFVIRPFGLWLAHHFGRGIGPDAIMLIGALLVVAAIVGVVLGTGWITYTTGRLLTRFGRRPGMLLAGRQLMADPWSGSRTLAALLAAVIIGAGVFGIRSTMLAGFAAEQARDGGTRSDIGFFTGTFALIGVAVDLAMGVAAAGILVTLADGIVARRRAYAALVATGVPRRTLGEAIACQMLGPLVPATIVSLIVGIGLVLVPSAAVAESSVPVPLGDLVGLGGVAVGVMVLVVGFGLLFLRMSTDLEELRVG